MSSRPQLRDFSSSATGKPESSSPRLTVARHLLPDSTSVQSPLGSVSEVFPQPPVSSSANGHRVTTVTTLPPRLNATTLSAADPLAKSGSYAPRRPSPKDACFGPLGSALAIPVPF